MENASLPSNVSNNVTTSSSEDVTATPNTCTDYTCDPVLRVVYIFIGSVGVIDNLFVIIIFIFFIKIASKVMMRLC